MKNKGNLILVLITGAAFGAALGMLFSPHSGTVTRRIIRRKGEAIADELIETIREPLEELSNTITDKFELLKKDLKSRFS